MLYRLTIIYDDRVPVPAEIQAIIGARRFSDIFRRRVSLGEIIRREVADSGCDDFFHLIEDRDAHFLADLIQANQKDRIFLRLPSSLMPTHSGKLAELIAQCTYAPGTTLLMRPTSSGEAPCLCLGEDVLPLLRPYDPVSIRNFFQAPDLVNGACNDQCGFTNLASGNEFLAYMGNATETRLFNSTSGSKRVLRKSSSDRSKMQAEYQFFHIAPEVLKPFLMPTHSFEDDGHMASYAMERLAIPDAALQFIHNAFDSESFSDLLNCFTDFIVTRPVRADGVDAVRAVARRDILGKMDQRLATFLETDVGRKLDALLTVSGPAGSLSHMAKRAQSIVSNAINRDKSNALAVSHGDPCLSNILFDRRTGMMRLIDPRGAMSLDEAYMHPLYDVAKFSHSILGGYDFINNDLFDSVIGPKLQLQLHFQGEGAPSWAQGLFLDALSRLDLDLNIIRAYELSLFMSMLPLHVDHPRKLIGFALIAARMIDELESKL